MSDLISRSKVVDLLLTENQRCITSTGHELTMNMIVNFIEKQPTAYDIDGVVEELEYNRKNVPEDKDYYSWISAIDNAIEIVKQGSVGKVVE